jgi:hypothetical protein
MAVDLLPKLGAPELQAMERFRQAPLNKKWVQELITSGEPALEEVRRGVALRRCDWGVDLAQDQLDNPDNNLLMDLNRISQLGCLRDRLAFQQGKPDVAFDNLVALIILARNVGRTGPLIAKVVEIAFEVRSIETAAAHLPEQSSQSLRDFAARLVKLAPPGTLQEAMHGEKEFFRLSVRPKYQKMNFEEAIKHLGEIESKEATDAIRAASGGTIEGLLTLVDRASELYDALGLTFMLPESDFLAGLKDCRQRHGASNPLTSSVFTHALGVRYAAHRRASCFDMLKAAVAVLLDGPHKLQEYEDPSGGGPYALRQFKGGFELHSKLTSANRPPALLVIGRDKSLSGAMRRVCRAIARMMNPLPAAE